jgi:hemolysin activation/secretion protein
VVSLKSLTLFLVCSRACSVPGRSARGGDCHRNVIAALAAFVACGGASKAFRAASSRSHQVGMTRTLRWIVLGWMGWSGLALAEGRPAAPIRFDVNDLVVEGNTVLPQDEVEQAVYPFVGPGKTAADLEAARAALEGVYQREGYATVSATLPAQHVNPEGVFRIVVIERPVERLRVTGSRYFLPSAVKAGAPSLAEGKVPNMHRVQDDLIALNQSVDRVVQPALRPGRDPNTVDVDLQVTDHLPFHGSVELNNRYNADTTHLRLNAQLSYTNLFQRGDSVSVGYQVAPEDVSNAEVTSASYLFHIPESRLALLFSYLHSNSNVTALGSTEVAGRGTAAGFRLLVPLGTNAGFTHSISVGWDYKRYYELDTFLASQIAQSAPVTYYPISASYTATWSGEHATTDVSLGTTLGIDRLGSDVAAFQNKRFGAVPGFAIARASADRTQDLPWGLQGWASAAGQVANEPLVSSEQFGLGGVDSVRGYLEAEALGDYGASLQTELRGPALQRYVGGPVRSWRFHVFGDAGVANIRQALPGQRSSSGLTSVGVGTRVNLWGYLSGTVQDAQVLNNGPDTKAGTNRVLFNLRGEF